MDPILGKLWRISCSFLTCYILSYISILAQSSAMRSSMYAVDGLCGLSERLAMNCTQRVSTPVRSRLDCLKQCTSVDACIGASLDPDNVCFLHYECWSEPACTPEVNASHGHQFYNQTRAQCQNGGVFEQSTRTCQCVNWWVGDSCERLPVNCDEPLLYGYTFSGSSKLAYLNLTPSVNDDPILVKCKKFGSIVQTDILHNYGMSDFTFNRTWSEYETGFTDISDIDSDYWIGLQPLKLLLDHGSYSLTFLIVFRNESSYRTRQKGTYSAFTMQDASGLYRIGFDDVTFTGDSVTADPPFDCFSLALGLPFSTWDNDNDLDPAYNVALEAGNGWWFNQSSSFPQCNLMGRYYTLDSPNQTLDKVVVPGLDMAEHGGHLQSIRAYLTAE